MNSPTLFARRKSKVLFLDLFEEKLTVVLLASKRNNAQPMWSGMLPQVGWWGLKKRLGGLRKVFPTERQSMCLKQRQNDTAFFVPLWQEDLSSCLIANHWIHGPICQAELLRHHTLLSFVVGFFLVMILFHGFLFWVNVSPGCYVAIQSEVWLVTKLY